MSKATKEIREANFEFAAGMVGTGGNLLVLAAALGGSALFIQWGIWFIVVGWVVGSIIRTGADAVDYVGDKLSRAYDSLPEIPFRKAGK